jgi:cytochrome c551/c552
MPVGKTMDETEWAAKMTDSVLIDLAQAYLGDATLPKAVGAELRKRFLTMADAMLERAAKLCDYEAAVGRQAYAETTVGQGVTDYRDIFSAHAGVAEKLAGAIRHIKRGATLTEKQAIMTPGAVKDGAK